MSTKFQASQTQEFLLMDKRRRRWLVLISNRLRQEFKLVLEALKFHKPKLKYLILKLSLDYCILTQTRKSLI
jgi:hypothetical protein